MPKTAKTTQWNFYLPEQLAERIDMRVGKLGLTRTRWLLTVLEQAVDQPVREITTTVTRIV